MNKFWHSEYMLINLSYYNKIVLQILNFDWPTAVIDKFWHITYKIIPGRICSDS